MTNAEYLMSNPPFLIVGLGNPGEKYSKTRHNLGFVVVDELIKRYDAAPSNTKLLTKLWSTKRDGHAVLLAEPQTFMNLSGNAIAPLVRTKKISLDRLIVVHDDLDLPFGKIRVSHGASSGGHNGAASTIDSLASKNFTRVRIGIDRPENNELIEGYVLSHFGTEERKALPELIDKTILEI